MKLVQAHFSARKQRESTFHHRGSAVKHVQACLSAKKTVKAVFTTVEVCCSSCKLILLPGKIEKAVLITV